MSKLKKILVADPSEKILNSITSAPDAKLYEFAVATTGSECIEKINSFKPDLVVIDLLLPDKHGIEILRIIKTDPNLQKTGVIISSDQRIAQNYHIAMQQGADYFLLKPFDFTALFQAFAKFFSHNLSADPFSKIFTHLSASFHSKQVPVKPEHKKTRIKFWGTRGSHPVSGPDYIRYGGNTCCLEIQHGEDLIIIDAGSGIRPLGVKLAKQGVKRIHLFISHTHLDHVTGFPFFEPIYHPEAEVNIWGPIGFENSLQEILSTMLTPSFFPITLQEINAKLSFHELRDTHFVEIGAMQVYTHHTYHPGATLGFKIVVDGKQIVYITDNELLLGFMGNPWEIEDQDPILEPHRSLIEFIKNADLLIHEAQYFNEEYPAKVAWGHSSVANATVLVKECNIDHWIVTHHDPNHTDKDIDRKLQTHFDCLDNYGLTCRLLMAHDEMEIYI
ncbi:MAG: response regulator [Chlamydiae bacterium]|nr:response regulator [Chlamydiota bacterium]